MNAYQGPPDAWIERNMDDPDDPYAEQEAPELEYAYDDLERTEATTDYFDHFPDKTSDADRRVPTVSEVPQEDRYWEEEL